MVQVVENRADVQGVVVAMRPDAQRPGHSVVTLEVHAVADVAPYPNLFPDVTGKSLDVLAPADATAVLGIGRSVRCRVRRTGPSTVFAERCSEV